MKPFPPVQPRSPRNASPRVAAWSALRPVVAGLLVALLAGCASTPVPTVRRDGDVDPARHGAAGVQMRTAGTDAMVADGGATVVIGAGAVEPLASDAGPQPQI